MNRETVSKEMKLKFNNLFYFSIIKGKFDRGGGQASNFTLSKHV